MEVGPRYAPPPLFDPRRYSRTALVDWCRNRCPDLRIGYAEVDGKRKCFARWTFGAETYEREADDEEQLAQQVASAIARLLRIPTRLDRAETLELERAVIAAAARGNDQQADELGRQLALRNAGALAGRVRTSFQR